MVVGLLSFMSVHILISVLIICILGRFQGSLEFRGYNLYVIAVYCRRGDK